MNKTKLPRDFLRLTNLLLRELGTPVALSVKMLIDACEYDQLATKAVDPASYLDSPSGAERYRKDTQAVDWLRKLETLPSSIDKSEVAVNNFHSSEVQCAETNYFLDMLPFCAEDDVFAQRYLGILAKARKIIGRIVGAVPHSIEGGFGPGTSYELQGSRYSTLADKMWVTPHVTRAALPVWEHTVRGLSWPRIRLESGLPWCALSRGNRFTTVPKDAKGDRGICIEPLGNLFCQLGIGRFLKDRLAKVGIYVWRDTHPSHPLDWMLSVPRPNGQVIHRDLAEKASVDGSWATIDLSNASDTVAKNLVRELFSPQMFELLNVLRSPKTRIRGSWAHLEKFSSMGNGFTFELETLIFLGLISAVTGLTPGVNLFVYGDDILVPTEHAQDALAVLRCSGFTPNLKKTFTQGPFRESCGGDFYLGIDVRAVFVKKLPESTTDWYSLHNQLFRKGYSGVITSHCKEQVVTYHRVGVPPERGDGGFLGHPLRLRSVEQHITECLTFVPVFDGYCIDRWGPEFGALLASMGLREPVVPRGSVPVGLKASWISVS